MFTIAGLFGGNVVRLDSASRAVARAGAHFWFFLLGQSDRKLIGSLLLQDGLLGLLDDLGGLLAKRTLLLPWHAMDILQMPAQVATLCKSLLALGAREGSQASVLAKVVTEVATLLEGALAARVLALEEQLHALGVRVLHLDRLVPFFRDPFEVLGCEVLLRLDPVLVVDHLLVLL